MYSTVSLLVILKTEIYRDPWGGGEGCSDYIEICFHFIRPEVAEWEEQRRIDCYVSYECLLLVKLIFTVQCRLVRELM